MTGTGPFGLHPAGEFNFEPPAPGRALYLDPSPKRIRVVVADEVVADSRGAMLLHEGGNQPVYYFPPGDVRRELLEPSDSTTHCPKKGDASYHSIRVGERIVNDAAWCYRDPIAGAPPIGGLIAFYWDRVDHWLEEEEEVFFHPRDPYHRIDILPSSRQVRILRKGTLLAESVRAMALFETGLPPRWYLPREDIVAELRPSEHTTGCPYKGTASYFSARSRRSRDRGYRLGLHRSPAGGRPDRGTVRLLRRARRRRARRDPAGAARPPRGAPREPRRQA